MALTAREIIVRAYRTENLIPIGKEPTDDEIAEGLGFYRSVIASLIGNDIGQLLNDWEVPPKPTSQYPSRYPLYPQSPNQDYQIAVWANPPPNVNIITNQGVGGSLYFPPTPSNGARMALVNVGLDYVTYPLTIDGNGRLIEGAATLTLDANPTAPTLWFYRADLANWVKVIPLELDADSPLPDQFDDFLICLVFSRVAPANGQTVSDAVAQVIKHGHRLLKTTYLQSAPGATLPAAWRLSTYQGYGTPWRTSGGGF